MSAEAYCDGMEVVLMSGGLLAGEQLAALAQTHWSKPIPFKDKAGNIIGRVENLRVVGDELRGDLKLDSVPCEVLKGGA